MPRPLPERSKLAAAALVALLGTGTCRGDEAPGPRAAAADELPAAGATAPATVAAPPDRARRRGADWPRFLGPAVDSTSTEGPLPTTWDEDGPRLVWLRDAGEGYAGPVVARGRLFLFDRRGDRARLACLDSESGEELWVAGYPTRYEDYYQYSGGPRTSPLVDGGRVFTYGVEGRLRAHRIADGELLWEVDTVAEFGVVQDFFGVGSSPVVEGDLLIAMVGGSPPGSPKIHSGRVQGDGSGLVAFDKATGEVRWRATDELASYASPVLATLGGRRWGFAFARGGLIGFHPATGDVDFHFPWRAKILESVNASTPVVVGDTVFISETYGPGSALLRVRPGAAEVVWQDPPGRGKSLRTHWSTPVHAGGVLYASSGRNSGDAELRAVDHDTGRVLWRQPGLTRSTLLLVDGHLVVLGERGVLRLVRATPERYEEVAAIDLSKVRARTLAGDERPVLSYPAWNAPVLARGLLYLRGKDTLAALELIPQP